MFYFLGRTSFTWWAPAKFRPGKQLQSNFFEANVENSSKFRIFSGLRKGADGGGNGDCGLLGALAASTTLRQNIKKVKNILSFIAIFVEGFLILWRRGAKLAGI